MSGVSKCHHEVSLIKWLCWGSCWLLVSYHAPVCIHKLWQLLHSLHDNPELSLVELDHVIPGVSGVHPITGQSRDPVVNIDQSGHSVTSYKPRWVCWCCCLKLWQQLLSTYPWTWSMKPSFQSHWSGLLWCTRNSQPLMLRSCEGWQLLWPSNHESLKNRGV